MKIIPTLRFDEWRGTMDGRPTMWVRYLIRRGNLRVDIHKIIAADDPECWHTHPALALRLILWRGYIEEMSDGSKRTWRPGMIGLVRPELCHRIDGLRGGASYSIWWQWGRRQMVELHGAGWQRQEQLYRARNTVIK
jgi:hypothetical protein